MKLRRATGEFSLEEALWEFATPKLKRQLIAARNAVLPELKIRTDADLNELSTIGFAHFNKLMEHWSGCAGARDRLKSHLAGLLLQGQLVANGVQIKPTLGKRPQMIPSHIFDNPKMTVGSGTVENFGRQFRSVRVQIAAPRKSKVKTTIKSAGAGSLGRPSKKAEIDRVIEALEKDKVDLRAMGRKEAQQMVLLKASSLGSNICIGFSPPVVQRALVQRYGKRA